MKIVQQFRARPLQAILTILALALGVAAVTAIAAFINVSRREQTALTISLWARELTMQTREDDLYNAAEEDGSLVHEVGRVGDEPIMLTEADMERAREGAPLVDYGYVTSPVGIDMSNITKDGTDVLAVSKDYLAANDITVSEGSSFTDSDYTQQRNVALVSPRLVKLMGVSDPIGKHVKDEWGGFDLRALGASWLNVCREVSTGTALLAFMGAAAGALFAALIVSLLQNPLGATFSFGLPFSWQPLAALLVTLVTVLLGVLVGFFPAFTITMRTNPIEALKKKV